MCLTISIIGYISGQRHTISPTLTIYLLFSVDAELQGYSKDLQDRMKKFQRYLVALTKYIEAKRVSSSQESA